MKKILVASLAIAPLFAGSLALAQSTATPVKPGFDSCAISAATNGQPCQFAAFGNVTPVVGGSSASSLVLKASPGYLQNITATCGAAAACYLMVFNATSAPGNGSTTAGIASGNMQECLEIAAGLTGVIDLRSAPEPFTVGITAVMSSTGCPTLTAATTGFVRGLVQ